MAAQCGTCTACCKVFAIGELKKPAGEWCGHCDIGVGCRIYERRPKTCVEFECLWLVSQSNDNPRDRLSIELRPDKSRVVFGPTTNENIMVGITMPGSPLAWQAPKVAALIDKLVKDDYSVVVGSPTATVRTMLDRSGAREAYFTEPDEHGVQYNIPERRSD